MTCNALIGRNERRSTFKRKNMLERPVYKVYPTRLRPGIEPVWRDAAFESVQA